MKQKKVCGHKYLKNNLVTKHKTEVWTLVCIRIIVWDFLTAHNINITYFVDIFHSMHLWTCFCPLIIVFEFE